jgi:8-amino-7-oxononanoate synthase
VGDAAAALGASASLLRQGFHVPAIRPPTVPAGSSRLRIALSAAHSRAQITALAQALRATGVLSRRLPLFR